MELHLHSAVLVSVNLRAFWADYKCSLWSLHERLGSEARRPEGSGGRHTFEVVGVVAGFILGCVVWRGSDVLHLG